MLVAIPALVFGEGLRRTHLASMWVGRSASPRDPLCRACAGLTRRPVAYLSNAPNLHVLRGSVVKSHGE